jgi:hypothetical protein
MRIAVVGGGFYGCLVALRLSEIAGLTVDLFERKHKLLSGAISANQHRLHLGFHYPRCDETIQQAIASFDRFQSSYSMAVEDIANNIYCVHSSGAVSAEDYVRKMRQHNLSFEEVATPIAISNAKDIAVSLRVHEKMINLSELTRVVYAQVAASRINTLLGQDIKPQEIADKYSCVINCTYIEPGEGVGLRTKSELAIMLLARATSDWSGRALTIMDGPFCSIYPADNGFHTISSVVHTPAIRAASARMLEGIADSLSAEEWAELDKNILTHVREFVDIDGFNIFGRYVTVKTKLEQDRNDFRGTVVVQKENIISVMAGKISCAFLVIDDILKKIGVE